MGKSVINKRLRRLGIPEDSDVGILLNKLDEVYEQIDKLEQELFDLKIKKEALEVLVMQYYKGK